jgi:hypothetical protein
MAEPQRVQQRRTKGWRLPPNTVVVGRPSRWGNPWSVKQGWTLAECYSRFETYLVVRRTPLPGWDDIIRYPSDDDIRRHLAGKNLACWCPPPAPGQPDLCHAALLLHVANEVMAHA